MHALGWFLSNAVFERKVEKCVECERRGLMLGFGIEVMHFKRMDFIVIIYFSLASPPSLACLASDTRGSMLGIRSSELRSSRLIN